MLFAGDERGHAAGNRCDREIGNVDDRPRKQEMVGDALDQGAVGERLGSGEVSATGPETARFLGSGRQGLWQPIHVAFGRPAPCSRQTPGGDQQDRHPLDPPHEEPERPRARPDHDRSSKCDRVGGRGKQRIRSTAGSARQVGRWRAVTRDEPAEVHDSADTFARAAAASEVDRRDVLAVSESQIRGVPLHRVDQVVSNIDPRQKPLRRGPRQRSRHRSGSGSQRDP